MKSALLWAIQLSLLAGLGASRRNVEQVVSVPKGWTKFQDVVNPARHMRLSIALRQPNIDQLEAKMAESGNRLSVEEIRQLQAPDQKDVDAVLQWLSQNKLKGVVDNDFIHFTATVAQAEPLLGMKVNRFAYQDKKTVLRTTKYTVPDSVAGAISFIHPPGQLHVGSPWARGRICTLYNITSYTPANNHSPVIFGVAGFLEENANLQDLQQFLNTSAPNVAQAGRSIKVELVNGGVNSQDLAESGHEAALDVDYAVSVGFPSNVVYYSTGGRGVKLDDNGQPISGEEDDNEPYLDFLKYLLVKPDHQVPHVLSLSYSDDELSVPRDYAKRVCSLLGLLTSRGTSIIFSSGDGGARGGRDSSCLTHDGTKRPVTMATFPPTCPWVTSVGAVTNIAEPPSGASFSTGGFSQYFARPNWQDSAVKGYVQTLNGHLDGLYNPSMRAIPDVSAVGTSFQIIAGGIPRFLQGTSASAPVFASLVALINDARLRAGKKSLGFLNNHLYSNKVKGVLQDITAGKSISCVFNDTEVPGGWPAAKGWDAITGLGVPKEFDKFLKRAQTAIGMHSAPADAQFVPTALSLEPRPAEGRWPSPLATRSRAPEATDGSLRAPPSRAAKPPLAIDNIRDLEITSNHLRVRCFSPTTTRAQLDLRFARCLCPGVNPGSRSRPSVDFGSNLFSASFLHRFFGLPVPVPGRSSTLRLSCSGSLTPFGSRAPNSIVLGQCRLPTHQIIDNAQSSSRKCSQIPNHALPEQSGRRSCKGVSHYRLLSALSQQIITMPIQAVRWINLKEI
ncbi:hypothetical protein TrVGV298_011327 [Trichoderma virens]|nr:hypothetical protein TrVGV298_011327 [Trichoderma virens]